METRSPQVPVTYGEKLVDLQYQDLSDEERAQAAQELAMQELRVKHDAKKINQSELSYETFRVGQQSYQDIVADARSDAAQQRNKDLDKALWQGKIKRNEWREEKLQTETMSLEVLNKDAQKRAQDLNSPAHQHRHDMER